MQPLHDLERITKSKTFPLSTEIAATAPSVDEKPFFCHVPSTETLAYAVGSVSRSLQAALLLSLYLMLTLKTKLKITIKKKL